jgi:flavin-binding protein dodecin
LRDISLINWPKEGCQMQVAKVTEIIASSEKSFDDAVKAGIARAGTTLKNISGAWVKDQQVVIDKNKIVEYRVNLKVTFVLED